MNIREIYVKKIIKAHERCCYTKCYINVQVHIMLTNISLTQYIAEKINNLVLFDR